MKNNLVKNNFQLLVSGGLASGRLTSPFSKQTPNLVWILDSSVLPQPANERGSWDDTKTWIDTNTWYD